MLDVNLSVSAGCRIAIQGKNGAGKSTLVKLITGAIEPTSGEVWKHHNLKVGVLNQHEADELAELSASPVEYMQACFPGKTRQDLRRQLGAFGVAGDMVLQPLRTLSGGQRVRVLFAKICAEKQHLLLLDEPTNHLDIYSIDALAKSPNEFQGSVVLVTHNRACCRGRPRSFLSSARGLAEFPWLAVPRRTGLRCRSLASRSCIGTTTRPCPRCSRTAGSKKRCRRESARSYRLFRTRRLPCHHGCADDAALTRHMLGFIFCPQVGHGRPTWAWHTPRCRH